MKKQDWMLVSTTNFWWKLNIVYSSFQQKCPGDRAFLLLFGCGIVLFGMVGFGWVLFGLVWFGIVGFSWVWFGIVRFRVYGLKFRVAFIEEN